MRKGQVLVVTLLILSVVMTIVLSIASRSVSEVQVTTTQDESARALEAAEIGLERYLGTQKSESQTVVNLNASYNVPAPELIGGNNSFAVPYQLQEGDVATVDLPNQGSSLNNWKAMAPPWVRICWGSGTITGTKAEVEIYYEDAAHNVFVKRNGYDPAGTYSNFWKNNISADNCGTTNNYKYSFRINLNTGNNGGIPLGLNTNIPIFMRIRMLGNHDLATGKSVQQMVAVQLPGGVQLPQQGGIVEAVGVAGSTSQKVRATVSYWDLPAMFDSAIFSGTKLTKP